ncbi:MAG: alpha-L-fucosidase, partial [Bacteroidales bacterium]
MKSKSLIKLFIMSVFILTLGCKDQISSDKVLQPKRPKDFKPFHYKYTTQQLYEQFSQDIIRRAAEDVKKLVEVNEKGIYKPTAESLGKHSVPEWFKDAKLGIFIDWGPWSVAGYAPPRDPNVGTGGSYPDWYEFLMDYSYKEYHDSVWGCDFRRDDFLPLLTGENFDAEEYIKLAIEAGAKYIVPFARHHGGWAMWESKYTFRNAMEMGPKRDIYKEISEAARKRDVKLGLYFSIAEWEYPVIVDKRISQWDPTEHLAIFQDAMALIPRPTPYASYFPAIHDRMISGKIPVRNYYSDYMMPLFKEAVDKFDPDIIWYDGGWGTPVTVSRAAELSAYFYNQAEGRKEVVINNRAGSMFSAKDMVK